MSTPATYTALNLLETVIEFINMTPDPEDWSFKRQKYNDPRFVRLQQIMSLLWAFVPEISTQMEREAIRQFWSGDFIRRRSEKQYETLIAEIHSTIATTYHPAGHQGEISLDDLEFSYCSLLNYYTKLKKLLHHNKGIMEISYAFYFPYVVTEAASNAIRSEAESIARLLVLFIDPMGQRIPEKEMIEQFDYPEEDLTDLDIDWM